jgi:hypothetical protein
MRVFAFLDLDHPPVAWAVMRGMMVSADQALQLGYPGFISFMLAGMIRCQNNPRIFNESILERSRKEKFPRSVSRIKGMYFFQTKAEAKAIIGDKEWPPYFIENKLLELELTLAKESTLVDANWITHAPRHCDGRIALEQSNWIERYWNGEAFNDQPIWELIANGVAVVLDEEVRRKNFDYIKQTFPESHIPILMARLASETGSFGGLVTPYLLRRDRGGPTSWDSRLR